MFNYIFHHYMILVWFSIFHNEYFWEIWWFFYHYKKFLLLSVTLYHGYVLLMKKNMMTYLFVLKSFIIHIESINLSHVEFFRASQSRACIYTCKACYKLSLRWSFIQTFSKHAFYTLLSHILIWSKDIQQWGHHLRIIFHVSKSACYKLSFWGPLSKWLLQPIYLILMYGTSKI